MSFKKMGFLFLVIFCFPFLFVKAGEVEKVCTTYTYENYYFFNEINPASVFENVYDNITEVDSNGNKIWRRTHVTYFPNFEVDGKYLDESYGIEKGKVCLSEKESGCAKSWDLSKFYDEYKKIVSNGKDKNMLIDGKDAVYRMYEVDGGENKIVRYFLHSVWMETDTNYNSVGLPSVGKVDYSAVSTSDLVAGSIIPSESNPNLIFTNVSEGNVKAEISRRIIASDSENATPFNLNWNTGAITGDDLVASLLTPSLYYMSYQAEKCGKEVSYNAEINYYFKDTNEIAAPQWSKSGLEDGYTQTVSSPEVDTCTPDKESVDVVINGDDFSTNVYYTCTLDTPEGGPVQTGSAFLYVVLIACVASLGVGIWYFRKNNNNA